MSRQLFWQAVAQYDPSHDGWLRLMRFVDGRNDYSLALLEHDFDALSTQLESRYQSVVDQGRRLPPDDMWAAIECACLLGQSVFKSVIAAPESLADYVDRALGDAFVEERAAYWEGS